MNKSRQGSAHVIIIVVLVLAVLGALGFIFWQNFIAGTETTSQPNTTTQDTDTNPTTKEYDGEGYSFSYPIEGWKLVETEIEATKTPSIQSDNYEHNVGMGVDAGGVVEVYVSPLNTGDTIDKTIENFSEFSYIEDLTKITVSGESAYTFKSGYEGWRSNTVVYHDGKSYTISYQYKDEADGVTYQEAYDTIVATFKLD